MKRLFWSLLLTLLAFPAFTSAAASIHPQHPLALPTDQIWAFVAGNLAPLSAYLLNRLWSGASEAIKSLVHLVAAAIVGGITQAITVGGVGLNEVTLQFVVTAVVGALAAHRWFWSANGTSEKLRR